MLTNYVPCPLIIASIGDNELDLITRRERFEIAPAVPPVFTAARTLEIHDFDHPGIDRRKVAFAGSFDQYGEAFGEQGGEERVDALLQQGFTAGDLDQPTVVTADPCEDFSDRQMAAFVKGVFGIAPDAAQIASGEPDEDARQAGPSRLALDTVKDLVNAQAIHSTVSTWSRSSDTTVPV